MNSQVKQIEEQITGLSADEQLWLIERLVHRLRSKANHVDWEASLDAMAADPDVRRELRQINEEFAVTEGDGLENS